MNQKVKARFYPDDGGLKEPVRSFDETFNGFVMLVKLFFRK